MNMAAIALVAGIGVALGGPFTLMGVGLALAGLWTSLAASRVARMPAASL